VDQFVLCRNGTPWLRVVIPSSALQLRACEMGTGADAGAGGAAPGLNVTCYAVGVSGTASFNVQVE
jgi:hypothetical protein